MLTGLHDKPQGDTGNLSGEVTFCGDNQKDIQVPEMVRVFTSEGAEKVCLGVSILLLIPAWVWQHICRQPEERKVTVSHPSCIHQAFTEDLLCSGTGLGDEDMSQTRS